MFSGKSSQQILHIKSYNFGMLYVHCSIYEKEFPFQLCICLVANANLCIKYQSEQCQTLEICQTGSSQQDHLW